MCDFFSGGAGSAVGARGGAADEDDDDSLPSYNLSAGDLDADEVDEELFDIHVPSVSEDDDGVF